MKIKYNKIKLGTLVRIEIPSLHGPMKVTGRVTNQVDEMIEVKTQLHGYHIVDSEENLEIVKQLLPNTPEVIQPNEFNAEWNNGEFYK